MTEFRCLACGGNDFEAGPCGGCATNFRCAGCDARYNDLGYMIEVISKHAPRDFFSGPYIPMGGDIE